MFKSYIEQCLAGEVLLEEVDNFVAEWHNDKNAKMSLSEYLGFTAEEYKLWAENPDALADIILAHKNSIPIHKAIHEH